VRKSTRFVPARGRGGRRLIDAGNFAPRTIFRIMKG
jgi:hypothetical protein